MLPPSLLEFKRAFHRHPQFTHLNNAGQSPMCRPAHDTIVSWTKRLYEEGAHGVLKFHEAVTKARTDLASFLGATPDEVSFFPGASGAISQVAFGLDLRDGDEVLVWDQEYPSNFYPWRTACERSGAKLVVAPSAEHLATPLETLEKLVTPRTRVIATSWIQYRAGAQTDLRALSEFAHARGIFVSADIIQGAGCLPFDFQASGVDAACGGSHKWLASAHGAGYLLLRKERLDQLKPIMVGATTYKGTDEALTHELREGSARFEPGGKPFLEILALGAAASFFRSVGIDVISEEAIALSKQLADGLRNLGYELRTPADRSVILTFNPGPRSPAKTLNEIEARLKAANISHVKRGPGVRLSPHAHNEKEDIEKALTALRT